MAPHSSTLAWKIPWTEEPGRLQSMGLLRVGYDWATSLSVFTFMHWRRNPLQLRTLQCSCLGNPRDGEAWWAAIYGVAQSRTRLKRLSSSSSRDFTERHVRCHIVLPYSQSSTICSFNKVNSSCRCWSTFLASIGVGTLYLVLVFMTILKTGYVMHLVAQ